MGGQRLEDRARRGRTFLWVAGAIAKMQGDGILQIPAIPSHVRLTKHLTF